MSLGDPRTAQPLPRGLRRGERATLAAVAHTAIPEGERTPPVAEATLDEVERLLATTPAVLWRAWRALLVGIEESARLRYGRPFSRLDAKRRLDLLVRWHEGPYPGRVALRALLTPIKVAHFASEDVRRRLGAKPRPVPPTTTERPRYLDRVTDAAALTPGETIEADVVVVGTGAGGAVVAKELAERGCAVVLLEEGRYFDRRDFTGRAVEMQQQLYRDAGATFALGNTAIPVPVGRAVGGTTLINSGTCYRAPERVLTKWAGELGLVDFAPHRLAPYYEKVEAVLSVGASDVRRLGAVAGAIARGCDVLGYRHGPLDRNAPGCDGQELCCFGCPTDAKTSTNVSYVPLALRAGAQLFTGARATRILAAHGRAQGVEVETGAGTTIRIHARAVVVACGALLSPVLIAESGLCRPCGQLGRNLSIHPALAVGALFDEPMRGDDAIPQGYGIEEFHDEGLLFEGAALPPELLAGSIASFGPALTRRMDAYDRTALFGFLVEDASRGRVRPGPRGRPLVTYWLPETDVRRIRRGLDILARVYFAAGARAVYPFVHGFDELRGPGDLAHLHEAHLLARDFDLSAYHPLGTARVSCDRRLGVCDPDHEAWDLPGLFVVDGASLPSSPAVNPQLTIMALATRAAEKIARRVEE